MILITGGAGYIGSHAVLEFIKNYDVLILDNLSTGHIETIDNLKKVNPKIKFEKADLTKIDEIDCIFKKYNIEGVIHFAALSLVAESVQNPIKYYKNNIRGTYNLLKIMIKYNVLRIVFSSTAAVYGNPERIPIKETDKKNPINPYGLSKLTIEKILDNLDKKFNLKSIRLRYFNVAGADSLNRVGEWHNPETHLIPNVIKAIISSSEYVKVFGNDYKTQDGSCIRDYINVEDLILAHYLAYEYLKKENKSDVFNLGASNATSVFEIVQTAKKVTKSDIKTKIEPRRMGDPDILCADSSKASKTLNWYPAKSIEDSIKTAYNWEQKLQQYKKV